MNQLSNSEQQAFEKLSAADVQGLWAPAIENVTKSNDVSMFRRLVCDLKSQANDCPEVMKNILGDAYESIVAL
jgi:hypothetical protein